MIYKIQQHQADSEESFSGLGIASNNKRTWFDYASKLPDTIYNPSDALLFSIQFKLEKDVLHHNRSIYTFLDLLGDVGGLFDALKGISYITVVIYFQVFGNPMHEYLLRTTFLKNP